MPRLATLAAAIFALTLLAACGGSSSPHAGTATASPSPAGPPVQPSASQASSGKRRPSGGRHSGGRKGTANGPDPVSRSKRPAHAPRTGEKSEVRRTSDPLDVDPCRLVSRSEAQAIVRMAVARPELGLQGPTCIYPVRRLDQPITLSLQRVSLPAMTRLGRHVVRTAVSGRKAVCLDYGGAKLLVPLSTGAVLSVGAPCPIAQHLAATALRRLQ